MRFLRHHYRGRNELPPVRFVIYFQCLQEEKENKSRMCVCALFRLFYETVNRFLRLLISPLSNIFHTHTESLS